MNGFPNSMLKLVVEVICQRWIYSKIISAYGCGTSKQIYPKNSSNKYAEISLIIWIHNLKVEIWKNIYYIV